MRLWRWCGASAAASVRVQGSRTCISAVPPTNISTTTNSINRDKATFLVSRIVTLLQINFMHCHVVMWPQAKRQQPLSSCGSKNKLPSMQRRRQTSPFMQMQNVQVKPYNTCKHYKMFLCLSHSVVSKCLRPRPSISKYVHTLRTSYGSRMLQWPHAALVTARDG